MARVLGSGDLQVQTIITTLTADGPSVVVPDAALLFSAEFIRSGDDLWLLGPDGSLIVIKDYFVQGELPLLLSPDGAMLTPGVVASLVGPLAPGQYAQLLLAQAADRPVTELEKTEAVEETAEATEGAAAAPSERKMAAEGVDEAAADEPATPDGTSPTLVTEPEPGPMRHRKSVE